ncbi:acylneuraminate cytidylyltransferase family protein [Thalassospira sp. GO-4]|jgi:CMP-N-acetylneuraminic acid synthetase|uniref:acylneuraminate cytidylyltransferase family protein n=1 Tax=Thalassospira sp. GO-4 TaxID=2946605 RepID=UPI0020255391|nr:acylneuraminate cytidylyltransferase family protein [Thalassospira sp. GO-4]URK17352.1 acylneuraminate cytidylyltransferase family protein [Thalassospira sp. GO-4]
MKFLGIIPARSGSKRLPNKNLMLCNRKPLIGWTCEAAKESASIDLCIVSTDSLEIMETANSFGIASPFIRPEELSNDEATSLSVVKHALDWADEHCDANKQPRFDAVILLQPTSPLRTGDDIRRARIAMQTSNANTVVSVVKAPKNFSASKMMTINPNTDSLTPLQHEDIVGDLYLRDGPSILISDRETINAGKLYGRKVAPCVLDWESFVDIDVLDELREAERRLQRRHHKQSN